MLWRRKIWQGEQWCATPLPAAASSPACGPSHLVDFAHKNARLEKVGVLPLLHLLCCVRPVDLGVIVVGPLDEGERRTEKRRNSGGEQRGSGPHTEPRRPCPPAAVPCSP